MREDVLLRGGFRLEDERVGVEKASLEGFEIVQSDIKTLRPCPALVERPNNTSDV